MGFRSPEALYCAFVCCYTVTSPSATVDKSSRLCNISEYSHNSNLLMQVVKYYTCGSMVCVAS
eukprot:m.859430 g.859430  ORF g.859430 m.859430 type:complete len:63 (+) comp23526_c0_seq28:3119-3307(+)